MDRAIIVTSFRLPIKRLVSFFRWNNEEIVATGAKVLLVCDFYTADRLECEIISDYVLPLVYPTHLTKFSITRTANYGLRRAVDDGYRVAMKTDIDVAFLGNLARLLEENENTALVPKYGDAESYETKEIHSRIMPDGQGTISMTTGNWARLEGYDERFQGWGGDDNEMVRCIKQAGIIVDDQETVAHIKHDTPNGKDWNVDGFNPHNWKDNSRLPPRKLGSQHRWGYPE